VVLGLAVFATFQLLMLWLYPIVIAPLFNNMNRSRMKPEGSHDRHDGETGLKTAGVYQVDEGKRSRHTNAYFTGIGKPSVSSCMIPPQLTQPR